MGGELIRGDRKGIFTLYEAGLFFVFLLVASSIISAYNLYPMDDFTQRKDFSRHCEESRKAILSATVKETGYIDRNGEYVTRNDISVRHLLMEQLYLEESGIPRHNFSYPDDIRRLANRHFRYNWILRASSQEHLIIGKNGFITDLHEMHRSTTGTVTSSSWEEEGPEGIVEITLYLYE